MRLANFVFLIHLKFIVVSAIGFYLKPGERKCLSKKSVADVLVRGNYGIEASPELSSNNAFGVNVFVHDERGQLLYQKQRASKGSFTFTQNQESRGRVISESDRYTITLVLAEGSEAKNYDDLAEAEKLRPLEIVIRRLEDMSNDIVKNFELLRFKEQIVRATYEKISSKVLYFSGMCMMILVCLATWQIVYLRRYFKAKKLIE